MSGQYDDNRYGQPIDDVTVFHDIIDARKLRNVMNNSESAMFSPQTSQILSLHNKKKESDSNITDWIYQNYDVRKDADKRLLKALFLYLYRGTDPSFFPATDEVDEAMEGLIQMVDNSPYADPYRKMCRLNRWHADVIGRLMFDEIMAEAKGMMDALSRAVGEEDSDSSPEGDDKSDRSGQEGDAESGESSSSSSDGGSNTSSEEGDSGVSDADSKSDSSKRDAGESEGPGDGSDNDGSNGENSDKAKASGNSPRTDTQTLVNRAMERVREFTQETNLDATTSIEKALEAAKKLGDGENNPLVRHNMQIDVGDIADKMGRMRSVFDAEQATRIEFAPGAVVSLCYSNDIRNVVPSELALMADPATSVLFDLKYLQRRLLTRKTEGVTRGGKGPIIMCLDVSGSMDRKMLSWSMSLAGAIGYTASSQGRDVAFIYYSDTVPDIISLGYEDQITLEDLERAIESVVYNQRIGTGDPHEHSTIPRMQAAGINRSCQANGGFTNYGCAFDAVKDLFQLNPEWEKADLLFLTDGGDSPLFIQPNKEKCELLQEMGVRAYGIGLVDIDHGQVEQMMKMMKDSLGYFDSYATVKFGARYSTEQVIQQIAESL